MTTVVEEQPVMEEPQPVRRIVGVRMNELPNFRKMCFDHGRNFGMIDQLCKKGERYVSCIIWMLEWYGEDIYVLLRTMAELIKAYQEEGLAFGDVRVMYRERIISVERQIEEWEASHAHIKPTNKPGVILLF
jgi:hypothetical protein